jgi:hypothetical protein
MADNTTLPIPETMGDVFAADDIGGVKFQRVKMIIGADGVNNGDISASNPLPVSGTFFQATQPVSGTVSVSGVATAANQTTGNTSLSNIDTKTPALITGRVPVDGSGVTQPISTPALNSSGTLTGVSQAITLALGGTYANATFQITGTWSGTVQFEASNDAFVNSTTIFAMRAGDNIISQSVVNSTNNDIYRVTVAGFLAVRCIVTAYTSGSIVVTANASQGTSGVFLNFPLPAGTNNIGGVTLPNDAVTTFTQAGVIAINTDLLIIDCQGLEAVSIHCTSMGTTGVVTPAWSNTNVTADYIAQSIMTPAGVAAATFNAAGMWVSVKQARFLRLRLTTATTAGTTTINVLGVAQGLNFPVQVQPISGAVTVSSGTVTTVSTVTSVASSTPVTPTQSFINSAATTNATSVKASAGTVWSIIASNVNAAARYVKFYNLAVAPTVGTSVPVFTITIPAGQTVQIDGGSNGIRFGTGISLAITGAMADADTTVVAANEIKVSTSFT